MHSSRRGCRDIARIPITVIKPGTTRARRLTCRLTRGHNCSNRSRRTLCHKTAVGNTRVEGRAPLHTSACYVHVRPGPAQEHTYTTHTCARAAFLYYYASTVFPVWTPSQGIQLIMRRISNRSHARDGISRVREIRKLSYERRDVVLLRRCYVAHVRQEKRRLLITAERGTACRFLSFDV